MCSLHQKAYLLKLGSLSPADGQLRSCGHDSDPAIVNALDRIGQSIDAVGRTFVPAILPIDFELVNYFLKFFLQLITTLRLPWSGASKYFHLVAFRPSAAAKKYYALLPEDLIVDTVGTKHGCTKSEVELVNI